MDTHVWILRQNDSSGAPIGAHILAKFDSRVKVKDDDLHEYWVTEKEILGFMHITSVLGVDDMTFLGELHEHAVLRNLLIRYSKDLIYTYIGSILVAVNPYKPLPIFGRKTMAEYRKKKLGELQPHIFAVADHTYESMRKFSEKRCLLISGESGAGKTESTKLFLKYFATISQKLSGKEQQILDSNPILEAFGNAKTIRNDNSSRFGKYISIIFNTDGSIRTAQIKQYLLEKSRIVYQSSGEQNYHIFYALLTGLSAEEKERLKLDSVSSYNYLNPESAKMPPTKDLLQSYDINRIKRAMKNLNFSDTEIWRIFELIALILHLGNIEFETVSESNVETINSVTKEEIRHVGALLQVSENNVTDSLTKKTISTHGDNVVKFLTKQEAVNSRDAFVKKIFGDLFNYIVEKINSVLWNGETRSKSYIGILDIFGFEVFDRNSFEQLCINYANERLQQFFIGHVFKTEQEQYASEGINWKFVEYSDNQEILDLLETGPNSVLSVINDATKIPRGSDQSMLEKLIEFHSENPFFFKPKYKNIPVFGIQHFAGTVLYDTRDFVEKNYDSCSLDIKHVIQSSENDFLKKVFASDFESDSQSYYKRRMETLSSKFKNSLDLLMNELNECQPFFVRCIKPNEMKKPQKFDRTLCCKQLKCLGLTEVTKVREAGYPVRYDFVQFVQHYRFLVPGIPRAHQTACKEATQRICRTVFRHFPRAEYQLGSTKVFLKHNEELILEAEREKVLYSFAVVIQKIVRGWLARKRYAKLKKAVLLTETCWAKRREDIQGKKIRNGLQRLQTKIKSRVLTSDFHHFRQLISRLQALCRGYLLRSSLQTKFKKSYAQVEASGKPDESADFKEFAKTYFQDKQNHKFSKKPLKNSLTHLVQPEERLAAKAIWLTILRYTRNTSEPQGNASKVSVGAQLREILRMISKGNNCTGQGDEGKQTGVGEANHLYENWLKTRSTDVQKLCFIVGHGIRRARLRDEIYCQICKMITKNPSQKAANLGWDLLSSCAGCFPPSDLFLKYLKTFIRQGPTKYISFCLFRLHRTIQNGRRKQPPFTTEMQAIKRQKPVSLEVFLMNGATSSVKIDSATTAKEMLNVVAKNIKLTDTFGFSLVLAQEVQHFSLGDGSTFVLDVISEYEQYIMEVGGSSENAELKFYLKREMFAPWLDIISEDEISTDLTYHQIKAGVLTGMYGFNETNSPALVARICYVEDGFLQTYALKESVDKLTATYAGHYSTADLEEFKRKIISAYYEMFGKNERSPNSVRAELIKHAETNWTLEFSKFFHVSGSIKNISSSQPYPDTPMLLGVNSKGIFIVDESNEKRGLARMDFIEISEVSRKEVTDSQGYVLKIKSYEGIEISLTFQSEFDNDVHKLLIQIIETLKSYSKFVIAVKNYKTMDKSFLELEKGDLIALNDNLRGRDLLRNAWAEGTNRRTGESGNFLLDCVVIISALGEPGESTVHAIADVVAHGKRVTFAQFAERMKHYTLESYAGKHFRNEKGKVESELWKYSREKIQQPLHSSLVDKDKEAKLAVEVFQCILQYTENNQLFINEEELVCKIFTPGLENEELRDEIYCQVMKQLTSNANTNSEMKVWELMWMVTGLFSCKSVLANEVKKFLQSRRTIQIARECLARFYKVLDLQPRRHPPHPIEIEAVKHRPCHLFHRIYFPDDTHKFFQVDSLTKFSELKDAVLTRLKINLSKAGFCVLLQISERLFLPPEDFYVMDYLQILKKWIENSKISKADEGYKICFMKYTWTDSVPGSNKVIDLKFLFPQEYNYYIQGHYDIPQQDLVQLAGLLYKINSFDESAQPFQKIVQKLIPPNASNLTKAETWQKEIQASCRKHNSSSKDDCKIMFLKHLKKFSRDLPYFTAIPHTSNLANYMFYPITSNSRSVV